MSTRKLFIGGNWKSNNTVAKTTSLVNDVYNNIEFDTEKLGKLLTNFLGKKLIFAF